MCKYLFILFFLISFTSFSQDTTLTPHADSNTVMIHRDPRLELLIKKQIQINEETSREARRIGKGFRLLVINTNKRDEAIDAKTKLYTYFPELKTYLIYQAPYYKLKAGNFKEMHEAEDYRKKMQKYFPRGVYIMYDTIEIKLETDKEIETFIPG